jgi:hypothetical protein
MKDTHDNQNGEVPPDIAEAVAEIVADNGLEIEKIRPISSERRSSQSLVSRS